MIFGSLTVIETLPSHGGHKRVLCRCACGNTKEVRLGHLRSGSTKSCGCQAKKLMSAAKVRHGKWGTRIHKIWSGMIDRCSLPSLHHYPNYGGRGIYVCDSWKTFENFYRDMGEPPTNGHTLDRIDCDGPYSPENCKWSTSSEQQRNKTNTHWITAFGMTKGITDWAEEFGIGKTTISKRLLRGWDPESAVSLPVRRKGYKCLVH